MKYGKKLIILFVAALTITGCAGATGSQINQANDGPRNIADEPLVIQQSRTAAGSFNAQMIFMADQLERNLDRKNPQDAFIVTSFTNLHNLSETSAMGRLIAENLIHELQVRKWKVFEVRLSRDVIINEAGEFSLSRDLLKIKELYKVAGIVTGTYSVTGGHVFVNARVMDTNSGIVMSSAQIHLPVNWFAEALQQGEASQKTMTIMRIVGDSQSNCRDNPVCMNAETAKPLKK